MIDPGSFRDPCGFIVHEGNSVFRVINKMYENEYKHFIKSGLYELLMHKRLLIPHREIVVDKIYSPDQYQILDVEKIPFISYPYEWCFSQYKDAALLTLEIEELAIDHGMTLKDATPYNVQFHNGHPIFIDTLSFDLANQNFEWKAYKQFCEFFVIPLCLMAYKDHRLNLLLKSFINGIPLDLGVKLIPTIFFFKPSLFLHLFLHNKIQNSNHQRSYLKQNRIISKRQHKLLISYLKSFIENLTLPKIKTEWAPYYYETKNEKPDYLKSKEQIVEDIVKSIRPNITWDIGANDGNFSRISSKYTKQVISIDYDWQCIEYNYNKCKKNNICNIVPILSDLVNPSGGIGWNNEERRPLFSRSERPNLIIALALMHHIINANIPIIKLIEFLSCTNDYVILEYIPRTDPKVTSMIKARDSSWKYIEENELQCIIQSKFEILSKFPLAMSSRILYLLKLKRISE